MTKTKCLFYLIGEYDELTEILFDNPSYYLGWVIESDMPNYVCSAFANLEIY